ncbi:MAG: putative porin [Bacteroidota bacterium]
MWKPYWTYILIFWNLALQAQAGFNPETAFNDGTRERQPQDQREIIPDTFGVFEFRVDNPAEEQEFGDTSLTGFAIYDPADRIPFGFGHLGVVGSPAYAFRYQTQARRGYRLGLNHFDLYQSTGENLDYYRLARPYTNLLWMRGSNQNDSYIEANFSRNFANGISFVIDHKRWRQFGLQDQYTRQRLLNNHTRGGFWIHPPGSRYQAFISHAANSYEQEWNGGLEILPDDGDLFSTPQSADPFLDNTEVRYAYREWMLTQYLQFGGQRDSTGRSRRAFTISHQMRYDRQRYRLASTYSEAGDSAFFALYPQLFIDERGQRSSIQYNIFENSFRLSTFRGGKSDRGEGVQRDLLELGVTHQFHRLRDDVDFRRLQSLLLHTRLGFRPSDKLQLLVEGQLEAVGQIGDYRLGADGLLDLGKAGKLEFSFRNQLYSPSLLQSNYSLTGESIWDTDFQKTLETRIGGAYTIPILDVRAELSFVLLNNFIYFDTTATPQQAGEAISMIQLSLERDFDLGALQIRNRVLGQLRDTELLPLPRLVSEHSLFYDGFWFGVLDVNLGSNFRFLAQYRPYYFNPLIQQFTLSTVEEVETYLQIEPYFSMRVGSFRFFARYAMLNTVLSDDTELFFATANHPYPDGALRIGISWRLID